MWLNFYKNTNLASWQMVDVSWTKPTTKDSRLWNATYGRVPREKLWGVLRDYDVDGCLMLAVKSPYSCSEDCVRVTGVKSQPFSTGVGLRQWCVLLPLLFIVYIRVLHTTAGGRNLTW